MELFVVAVALETKPVIVQSSQGNGGTHCQFCGGSGVVLVKSASGGLDSWINVPCRCQPAVAGGDSPVIAKEGGASYLS